MLISAATSGLRAQSIVGLRAETSDATVVPHDPPPRTVTCIDDNVCAPGSCDEPRQPISDERPSVAHQSAVTWRPSIDLRGKISS